LSSQNSNQREENLSFEKNFILYLHDLMYLLVILMVALLLIFRVVIVSGTSMFATLYDGDYLLLLSNTFYHTPENGDIVVISKKSFDNGAPIVKRVIATEGETVDIDFDNGIVYVDGIALEEDYTNTLTTTSGGMTFPLTVSEGCVFALGDNRNISRDSRYPEIGLIDEREILGKAIVLLIPGTNYGEYPRNFQRIGGLS